MPSPLLSNIKKQAAQIAKGVAEEALKEPGKIAETAAGQVGISTPGSESSVGKSTPSEGEIKTMAEKDESFREIETQRVRSQLEGEIAAARMQRIQKEQLRKSQEAQITEQTKMVEQQPSPLAEVSTKKKRGLFGNWGRRIKTAQQQAMPEKSASRRSG